VRRSSRALAKKCGLMKLGQRVHAVHEDSAEYSSWIEQLNPKKQYTCSTTLVSSLSR